MGKIGKESCYAISGHDSLIAQRAGNPIDFPVQIGIAEPLLWSQFVPEDQRRLLVVKAQQVLGKVEARTWKPAGTQLGIRRGHPFQADDDIIPRGTSSLFRDDAAEPPNLGPEGIRVVGGPAVERGVVTHPLGGRWLLPLNVLDERRE